MNTNDLSLCAALEELDRLRAEVASLKEDKAKRDEWLSNGVYFTNEEYSIKVKLHQVMMDGFREVRHSLQFANESPNGGINDTIWMMDGNETVFDALDRLLSGADTELVWSKDVEIDRLRMMAQRLTQQLAAANGRVERVLAAFHVNMLHAYPDKSHEEIQTEIRRACALSDLPEADKNED